MEKPLKGVVLCCTSIAPEQRTHMAEAAIQMGAEHKLDLTSDVTHLIVGDSNTPKYKYVAREREDIRVLQLEWVEAVRQAWMRGDDVNLAALEDGYRLPTFAGLRICLTGFEDVTFRSQLQEAISANGGEYRGDLTKEVTHLIAFTAEGKKYQYATQWEVKVVGLKWLKDSLDRRMILEENLYHPTIPNDKQGAGAWNRQAKAEFQLGKRARDADTVPDVPRKLRRTTSAKLGSQSESLWDEIVSGPQGAEPKSDDQLRISKSLPPPKPTILEPKSFATDSTGGDDDRRRLATKDLNISVHQWSRTGIFAGLGFYLFAFNLKETSILRDHILSNDGVVLELLTGSDHTATSNVDRLVLIVPYSRSLSDLPSVEHLQFPPMVVTEFWVERCLTFKQYFEPDEHMLNRPLPVFPIPGFEKLIVNSTGIADIDLLHVSKVVKLLGAEYDQVLKAGTSILLCNPSKAGEDKLWHALEWRIPAVSTEWLWSCIRSGKMQPFDAFSVKRGSEAQRPHNVFPNPKAVISTRKPESMETANDERLARKRHDVELAPPADNVVYRCSLAGNGDRHRKSKAPKAKMALGEGFLKSPQRKKNGGESGKDENLAPKETTGATEDDQRQEHAADDHVEMEIDLPLQEASANSPTKAEMVPSLPKARLFRHFDGQSSLKSVDQDDDSPPAPNATSTAKTTYIPPQPESINGAIQELLSKSRAKHTTPAGSNGENRKRRLLGRAVSNMSNSSREGSSIRASRASSVDSVNTDGLGSVILDETSQSKRTNSSGQHGRSSFTGRASAHERNVEEPPLEPVDAALYREEYPEDEEPPQMTQLGYDNPEDAVALREMLAERRRDRSRKGQDDGKSSGTKKGKRIKDDATISATGWGTGRRTRQKMKGP